MRCYVVEDAIFCPSAVFPYLLKYKLVGYFLISNIDSIVLKMLFIKYLRFVRNNKKKTYLFLVLFWLSWCFKFRHSCFQRRLLYVCFIYSGWRHSQMLFLHRPWKEMRGSFYQKQHPNFILWQLHEKQDNIWKFQRWGRPISECPIVLDWLFDARTCADKRSRVVVYPFYVWVALATNIPFPCLGLISTFVIWWSC